MWYTLLVSVRLYCNNGQPSCLKSNGIEEKMQYDLMCVGIALVDSIIRGFNPTPVSASGYLPVFRINSLRNALRIGSSRNGGDAREGDG